MDQVKALAIALAAANGHPNPHAYADSVVAHLLNPPAEPETQVEQVAEQETEQQPVAGAAPASAEPEAPAQTGEAEKPADPQ